MTFGTKHSVYYSEIQPEIHAWMVAVRLRFTCCEVAVEVAVHKGVLASTQLCILRTSGSNCKPDAIFDLHQLTVVSSPVR
jgi:hypothetical protein